MKLRRACLNLKELLVSWHLRRQVRTVHCIRGFDWHASPAKKVQDRTAVALTPYLRLVVGNNSKDAVKVDTNLKSPKTTQWIHRTGVVG